MTFHYLPKERYMTDKEYSIERKRYKFAFPSLVINLILFIITLFFNDVRQIIFFLGFAFHSLFIPLTCMPYMERIFNLTYLDEKHLLLFMSYIVVLCLFIALIHYMIADENYKIILMAIIPALYCFVMTRYLTTVLETIENKLGLFRKM